jgi:hypothetical protein
MNSRQIRDDVRDADVLPHNRSAPSHGAVVTYSVGARGTPDGHETSSRNELARRLAALSNRDYAGEYDPRCEYRSASYFVPADTLTSVTAARLGIVGERDLFGGVVPHAFAATKTITHPLANGGARAPQGWQPEFPRLVAGVVLDGFAAYGNEDARKAGESLLERGTIRVKLASGIAGHGQFVVADTMELARVLDAIDEEEMARSGVVIEQNLSGVTTHSIGQVRVADTVATYYGTQRTTTNNRGLEVYGGSEIVVVRGDFDALLALPLSEAIRIAVAQARTYDRAADQCFSGFFASRRNYDVAQGIDTTGRRRSGVLEQSWRAGGASGAEIGALDVFRADPSLRVVRAMTREVHGAAPELPANAAVYFSGVDPHVGPLTKYAWTESYADTR